MNEAAERELRSRLERVMLVCEAELSDGLVDAAEVLVRPLLSPDKYELLARRWPASLVTYFVCRGVEVYERNELWPRLGVVEHSSRAGQAFLDALSRLGLPDFADQVERVGARRYVAPILIHGAFPASVANSLVDCIVDELRRGLVDGTEARQRLLRRSDLVQLIRRPASRLLTWCPEYADQVLDAVIDYVDQPDGSALQRLPLHVGAALRRGAEKRAGLRRLRVPRVSFAFWSGIGPQVEGAAGWNWVFQSAEQTTTLTPGDWVDLSPGLPATVTGAGRSMRIWDGGEVSFFDLDDHLISADTRLPPSCVVVLPRTWRVWDAAGRPIDERDQGSHLSGPWSTSRSALLDLSEASDIVVGPNPHEAPVRRTVSRSASIALRGPTAMNAVSVDGFPIFTEPPRLDVSEDVVIGDHLVLRRFDGTTELCPIESTPDAARQHVVHLPAGPMAGSLAVGEMQFPMIVVPGLEVARPQRLLGPTDVAEISFRMIDSGGRVVGGTAPVPAHRTSVFLPIDGLPASTIEVPVPRLLWSLRSGSSTRLEFADGPIRTAASDLVAEPMWLLVRSGVRTDVGVTLMVDGREHQSIASASTTSSGAAQHHRSFALDAFADSVRAHATAHLEFRLIVDGTEVSAVECGDQTPVPSSRVWRSTQQTHRAPDTTALDRVQWLRNGGSQDEGRSTPLLSVLRRADTPDAVVTFLRTFSAHQASWRRSEFPAGASAADWKHFETVADSLWRLTGVRHREFSGNRLERLRRWGGTRRERLRRASADERRTYQEWLVWSRPDLDAVESWNCEHLVREVLPRRADVTAEWVPAAVLFHVLALAGGDIAASVDVETAVTLFPELTLEAVAFALEFTRNGDRIHPAVYAPDDDDLSNGVPETETEVELPRLRSLEACDIELDGHTVTVSPHHEAAPAALRAISRGRALALSAMTAEGDRHRSTLPTWMEGDVQLQLVDPRHVPVTLSHEHSVSLPPELLPSRRSESRLISLQGLVDAHLDELVRSIAIAAADGRWARNEVELLFEDETQAARALLRLLRPDMPPQLRDLALIAALPSAILFGSLTPPSEGLRATPLAFAVLGPRDPKSWTALGWPNGQAFFAGPSWTDLAGFIRRHAPSESTTSTTFRYEIPTADLAGRRLTMTLDHLAKTTSALDTTYLDLVVATYVALQFDHLASEALAMIFTTYIHDPATTRNAVVAGTATALACNS